MISIKAHADQRIVHVDSPEDLVAAFESLGDPEHGPFDEVLLLLGAGEYRMDRIQGTNLALPEITGSSIRLNIQPEDPLGLVTIVGGGDGSNYGLMSFHPEESSGPTIVSVKGITFQDFQTEGNGAIISLNTVGHTSSSLSIVATLSHCIIKDVEAKDGGVGFVAGGVATSHLVIQFSKIDRVSATGSGGVTHASSGGRADLTANVINDVTAGLRGGVLYAEGASIVSAHDNIIDRSHAFSQIGGHFYVNAELIYISNNQFRIPIPSIGGLVVSAGSTQETFPFVRNNTFIDIPRDGAGISPVSESPPEAITISTLNLLHVERGDCIAEPFANDSTVESGGGNVSNDGNCPLHGPQDIIEPELLFNSVCTEPLCFEPATDSPAIDITAFDVPFNALGQSMELAGNDLSTESLTEFDGAPCGYKDIRGLARPQDGDLDGIFGCDSGAYEVQGGEDIGPAQSGAYFDLAHSGEGYFAEVLEDGLAWTGVFTHKRDGSGPAWYVGLGNVLGNSFVIDELLLTKGGVFGDAFDATAISNTTVAGFSANFPTCEATDSPGRWVIDPLDVVDPLGDVSEEELDTLLEEQTQVSTRLSQIVPCPGSELTASENAFRSGTYFDPARSGEGIFVQFLPNGQILVIFYTFDPQGNQMWIIAQGAFEGSTATIDALYPTSFTSFGSQFDPNEVVLSPWGTFTLSFNSCNSLVFSYQSTTQAYGSGSSDYTRLTQLAGTQCP